MKLELDNLSVLEIWEIADRFDVFGDSTERITIETKGMKLTGNARIITTEWDQDLSPTGNGSAVIQIEAPHLKFK